MGMVRDTQTSQRQRVSILAKTLSTILDDCTWPEEAQYVPPQLNPGPEFHILLTSDSGILLS